MTKQLCKRISSLLTALLLVLLLLPAPAHAAGASLSGSSSVQAGDSVTLTLSVSGSIYGLTADLSYGDNLSFTNYNCSVSGWSILVNNNKFSVYGTSSSSGGIITVKLKVASSAAAGDTLTATFSNITVSDGNSDSDLGSASWSGSVGAAPSGDCTLKSLTCGNATLSPAFSSSTTYYTCTVPYAVNALDLDWKKSDNGASVSVSGNELAVGANTVTLTVMAANGATKTYTIDVTREQDPNYKPSTDGSLSALTIEGATLSPSFKSTVTDYIAYVPYELREINVSATAKNEKAKGVTGTGLVRLSGVDSETLVTVTGLAEDGKSTTAYTIHVLRMPAYEGIIPTVEVIDPATIPEIPPLEIPGTMVLPVIGEVKTLYVAIGAAVLLVVVLFLIGFLIGRGARSDDDDYQEPPQPPLPPVAPHDTDRIPRLVPREEPSLADPVSETQELNEVAALVSNMMGKPEEPAVPTVPTVPAVDEPTEEDEAEVRTMSLDDLLDDIHKM